MTACLLLCAGCGLVGFERVSSEPDADAALVDTGNDAGPDSHATLDGGACVEVEACDGADDDCDGIVDEGCAPTALDPIPGPFRPSELWGFGADDIWAGGDNGVWRHAGTAGWQPIPTDLTTSVISLWGANASNVWAVDADGMVVRGDSTRLVRMSTPEGRWSSVHGTSATNVWIAGIDAGAAVAARWDGLNWSVISGPDGFLGRLTVRVLNATDAWVYSTSEVWRVQGASWTSSFRMSGLLTAAVETGGPNLAWMSLADDHGGIGVFTFAGEAWSPHPLPHDSGSPGPLWTREHEIVIAYSNDATQAVFAVDRTGTFVESSVAPTATVLDIWGGDDGGYYFIAGSEVWHATRF